MLFFTKNWKTLFFPLIITCIILLDQFFNFPFYITILKILTFSVVHGFYVKRTKYIYDSEIYKHYVELRSEYEKGFTLEIFISQENKKMLFLMIYFLTIFLCIVGNITFSGKGELGLLLCILSGIFIFDVFYELIRTFTNKTDFTRIKSKLPGSIVLQTGQKRHMYSLVMQKFVQHGPACINIAKGITAGLGMVEIGYATTFETSQCGPLTKYVANEHIYKANGLDHPINTRQDLIYEGQRKIQLDGIVDGNRAYCDMPKRNFSFCSEMERNEFLIKNRIKKED